MIGFGEHQFKKFSLPRRGPFAFKFCVEPGRDNPRRHIKTGAWNIFRDPSRVGGMIRNNIKFGPVRQPAVGQAQERGLKKAMADMTFFGPGTWKKTMHPCQGTLLQ